MDEWFWVSAEEAGGVIITATIIYALIGVYTRIFGLRSFAKLTAFDAAMTVAIGSVFATAITSKEPTILLTAVALGSLFALQAALSSLRRVSPLAKRIMENKPALVFTRGRFLRENMVRASLSEADIWGKLREANALKLEDVHAVIVETTGDIRVLHGSDSPDPKLLSGVRDGDQVFD